MGHIVEKVIDEIKDHLHLGEDKDEGASGSHSNNGNHNQDPPPNQQQNNSHNGPSAPGKSGTSTAQGLSGPFQRCSIKHNSERHIHTGGTYPRLCRLSDGSILCGVTQFQKSERVLTISKSTDGGNSFEPLSEVSRSQGDCDNVFLIEVPSAHGDGNGSGRASSGPPQHGLDNGNGGPGHNHGPLGHGGSVGGYAQQHPSGPGGFRQGPPPGQQPLDHGNHGPGYGHQQSPGYGQQRIPEHTGQGHSYDQPRVPDNGPGYGHQQSPGYGQQRIPDHTDQGHSYDHRQSPGYGQQRVSDHGSHVPGHGHQQPPGYGQQRIPDHLQGHNSGSSGGSIVLAAFRNHDIDPHSKKPSYFRITVCRSQDSGRSWHYLTQAIEQSAAESKGMGLWEPFMRVNHKKQNQIEMTYSAELAPDNQETFKIISRDGGQTWTKPHCLRCHPQSERLRDGMQGIVEVRDAANGREAQVIVFETTRRGHLFSVEYAISYDEGDTWKNRGCVHCPPQGRNAGAPQIEKYGHEGFAVVFMCDEDSPNVQWPKTAGVKVCFGEALRDGRINWSRPQEVNTHPSHWPGLISMGPDEVMAVYEYNNKPLGKLLHWTRS